MKIKLQILDSVCNTKSSSTLTSSYYRGVHAIIIVYDENYITSFENIKKWIPQVDRYAHEDVPRFIFANKCDVQSVTSVPFSTTATVCKYLLFIIFGINSILLFAI